MIDQDDFDVGLAAQFERAHRQVPGDDFVAGTMQKVRAARRRKDAMRVGIRTAVLVAAIVGSPWLIAAGARLNAVLDASFPWTFGLPVAWLLGALAAVVLVAQRVSR